MPTFDRKHILVLTTVAALFGAAPMAATQASSFGTGAKGEVVVAASSDTSSVSLPETIETVSPDSISEFSEMEAIENLPKTDQAHAWFIGGTKAYNAGEGQLAVEMWTKSADLGHIAAQWNLARLYRRGDIIGADPVKALTYLRIVADQHDPNRIRDRRSAITVAALVELADIYRAGEPEAKLVPDPNRASAVYNLAATLYGDARAQHELGMMYLTGEGVRQHLGRAVRWLGLSAGKRYVPSLAALGNIFWENRDAGDNKVQSLMWLSLARDNVKNDDLRAVVNDRYNAALIEASDDERLQAMGLIKNWNLSHAIP